MQFAKSEECHRHNARRDTRLASFEPHHRTRRHTHARREIRYRKAPLLARNSNVTPQRAKRALH